MWFKKKKKVTFNIEINEINSYISENYVPDENEKQIKFQAKKKAEPEPEIPEGESGEGGENIEEPITPEEPETPVEIVIDENEIVSKKNARVRNGIKWGDGMGAIGTNGAVRMSRSTVSDNGSAKSTLCYDVQWDAILDFVKETNNVTLSSAWGNAGAIQKSGSP